MQPLTLVPKQEPIMPAEEARLTRIESKVDQLGSALITLARIEERVITLFNRQDDVREQYQATVARLVTVEEMVDTMRQQNATRSTFFVWLDRIATAGVAATIAVIVAKMKGGN